MPSSYEYEIVKNGGRKCAVVYVRKGDIYPAFGIARGRRALVREDLPPRVKRFVREHELYHSNYSLDFIEH